MILTELDLDSSPQQKPQPPTQKFSTKIYNEVLNEWLEQIHKYNRKETKLDPLGSEYFKQIFLKNLHRKFRLSIIFDNQIAECVRGKLKLVGFMRFSMADIPAINSNFVDLEGNSDQLFSEQKWIDLLKISQKLYSNNFISKQQYKKIEQHCKNQKPIEAQLTQFYTMSKQKEKVENTSKISMKIWNKTMAIDCKNFWTQAIYQWPTLASKSKIVKEIFDFFQGYLRKKLDKQKMSRLKKLIYQPKKKVRTDYLYQMADRLCLFSYPKKVQAIEYQLQVFKAKLKAQFETSNRHLKISKFQNYGSFRSKICSESSDVDLTLFITTPDGEQIQARQLIEQCIRKCYYSLQKFNKLGDQQLQIQSVHYVLKCKVPFARVHFSHEMPLRQMDIVVNNQYGVLNSRMLEVYSENRVIRNIALVLKIWGKKERLIDPQKLSSYGLALMLLYFLMSTGYLEFPTHNQLLNRSFKTELNHKQQLLKTLLKFFQFYQRSSQYHLTQQTACLIKQCKDHNQIHKQGFVINIHDPFDGSNPGRLKQRDRYQFFGALDRTILALQEARSCGEVNRRERINEVFGFRGEDMEGHGDVIVIQ